MLQTLWTRFLTLLALFLPTLAFAQQAQGGMPGPDFGFVWLLLVALAMLLAVTLWAWTRRTNPPRRFGP
jgi:hypothetical protein